MLPHASSDEVAGKYFLPLLLIYQEELIPANGCPNTDTSLFALGVLCSAYKTVLSLHERSADWGNVHNGPCTCGSPCIPLDLFAVKEGKSCKEIH